MLETFGSGGLSGLPTDTPPWLSLPVYHDIGLRHVVDARSLAVLDNAAVELAITVATTPGVETWDDRCVGLRSPPARRWTPKEAAGLRSGVRRTRGDISTAVPPSRPTRGTGSGRHLF